MTKRKDCIYIDQKTSNEKRPLTKKGDLKEDKRERLHYIIGHIRSKKNLLPRIRRILKELPFGRENN